MENDREQQVIENDMERTRAALNEKLEALESQVADTVQTATEAVQATTEAVSETVSNVKETVESVADSVGNTVRSVSDSLNLSRQMELRPWLVFGSTVAAGFVLGWLTVGRSRRSRSRAEPQPLPAPAAAPPKPAPPTSHPAAEKSWFGEQVDRLKGLAIGTLMGAVRDVAAKAVPESVSGRLAEELDHVTTSLGGEPIHGKVFDTTEQPPAASEASAKEEGRRVRATAGSTHN